MGNKDHVARFMLDISNDPEKQQKFQDFKALMDEAGLTPEERAVVCSGDKEKIREHLGEDDPPGCLLVVPFI